MVSSAIRLDSESGQTMAEYALVLGVITFAIVTTFSLLSKEFAAAFERALKVVSSVI